MTEEEIDALPAGKETNSLVADKVMGWQFQKPTHGNCCTCQDCGRAHDDCYGSCDYSDSIESVWPVVEKFRRGHNAPGKDAVACVIEMIVLDSVEPEDCMCKIYSPCMAEVWATAREMPLAICKASLKAVLIS